MWKNPDHLIKQISSFDYRTMNATFSQPWAPGSGVLELLRVFCNSEGPLLSLVEACDSSLLPDSKVEKLSFSRRIHYGWKFCADFSAAKSFSLGSIHIVPPVALALKQVIEEGMTDVLLPAIRELSVSGSLSVGPVREAIERFVTARSRGLDCLTCHSKLGERSLL